MKNMINQLIKDHQPGYSLPRSFYTSAEVYEKDLALYWGLNWIWVGHASQLPDIGSYFVTEFGNESVIICLLYTSPSPRDQRGSRMPSSA